MATPAYKVLVDWDQDGDFSDANSDVTSDVRTTGAGIRWSRGKNVLKQRAESSVLELFLKNDTHVYSPSNSDSVLYPQTLPAPNIWVLVGFPVDDFDAANTTTLASRKPSHDDTFAAWEGDTGNFDVLSNKLRTSSGGNYTASLDFGESDCFVAVDFTRHGSTSGLVLRRSNATNFLLLQSNGTNVTLTKYTSGSLASLDGGTASASIKDKDGTAISWDAGVTKKLAVELHGKYINVFVDDVYQFTAEEDQNETVSKHGIGGRATNTGDRWDDFGGWRSVFYGRIDTIQPRPETDRQYCYVRAFDDMERLSVHQVYRSAPAGSGSTNADDIINVILDAAEFSAQNRILDAGTNISKYANHQKSMGRNALTELYQVQDDDVGLFYIDGNGCARYEASDHRDISPHGLARQTWFSGYVGDRGEDDIYVSGKDFRWEDGKDAVVNEAYFSYHRISRESAVLVWRLETDDRPLVQDKQLLGLIAIGDGDTVANPVTPVFTTDFSFNSSEDGSGTNLLLEEGAERGVVTASGASGYTLDDAGRTGGNGFDDQGWTDGKHQVLVIDDSNTTALAYIGTADTDGDGTKVELFTDQTLTTRGYTHTDTGFDETDTPLEYEVHDVTIELETGFGGNYRRIRMYNGSGSAGYVTFMRLRADKGTQSSKTFARAEASGSQTALGRRRKEHAALHIDRHGGVDANGNPDDTGSALDRAKRLIILRKTPKERIKCVMQNSTRANLMQILHRSMSDRIHLIYEDMDINDAFDVEHQTVTIRDGGLFVECDWTLQQSVTAGWGFWRWDQENWA